MSNNRIQLTLFVKPEDAKVIEFVRKKFNPEQYNLIKSHVTLCREDEIENLNAVLNNLKQLKHTKFSIEFGKPIRFHDGKGVYLQSQEFPEDFHNLRKEILKGIISTPRIPDAHITLIHPRKGTCTDEIFDEIKNIPFQKQLNFDTKSLIEQEIGKKWNIIEEFKLV